MATAEHLGNLLLLIVGGNDTTRNTMSASVYGLNTYPDQYDKLLADPGLVVEPGARDHPVADAAALHAPHRERRHARSATSRSSRATRS